MVMDPDNYLLYSPNLFARFRLWRVAMGWTA